MASVKKTGRLLAVYEGVKTLGIGAEISAIVAESEAFDYLDAPIMRLGGVEAPIPYSPVLEKAAVPQIEDIVAAARRLALTRSDMAVEIVMPRVDMDMTSGRMGRWHAAEGAHVVKGATLFEIETDKAAMEVDAPASGVLQVRRRVRGRRVAGRRLHRLDRRPGRGLRSAVAPVAQASPGEGRAASPPGDPLPLESVAREPVERRASCRTASGADEARAPARDARRSTNRRGSADCGSTT